VASSLQRAAAGGAAEPAEVPSRQVRLGRGLLLGAAAALWLVPFLWPRHRLPLATLDSELLAQAFLAAALIGVALASRTRMTLRWPLPALLLTLSSLAAWQFGSDRLVYGQQLLAVAWFTACVLPAYALGRAIHCAGLIERVVGICCRAAVAGAAVSVAVEWLQLLDVHALPAWLVFLPDDIACRVRPCGNVAQTNLLATYLGAGALATLYLRARGLRGRAPGVVLFWLACGLGMTGSRMTVLYLLFLSGLLAAPSALRPGSVRARAWLGGALWAGFASGVGVVQLVLGLDASLLARFAQETLGIRIELYKQAWLIGLQHPLLGAGAGQFGAAQYWVAQAGRYVQPDVNAHNLFLELAVEFGWPAATASLCVGLWWGLAGLRVRLARPETAFAWAVLVVLAIHSMLEYPLWYLFYAILAGLLFGMAEPDGARDASLKSWPLAPIGLSLLAAAAAVKLDADRFAQPADRFWSERSANLPIDETTRREVLALADDRLFRPQFERMLLSLDAPPHQQGPEYLELSSRVLSRLPEPEVIARHIFLLAQAGRVDEAVRHVERLRVFARHRYPEFRAVLMVHLPEHDPRLTPLRLALTE
jgi:O-antigen ligase